MEGQIEGLQDDIEIEIHQFLSNSKKYNFNFNKPGINHICLFVKTNREIFLNNLPEDIEIKSFDNPLGYKNIFIKDYENNWIELRENFNV